MQKSTVYFLDKPRQFPTEVLQECGLAEDAHVNLLVMEALVRCEAVWVRNNVQITLKSLREETKQSQAIPL